MLIGLYIVSLTSKGKVLCHCTWVSQVESEIFRYIDLQHRYMQEKKCPNKTITTLIKSVIERSNRI